MQFSEITSKTLFEAGSRGLFVRTAEAAAGKTVIFKNKDGRTLTAVGNALLPEVGLAYENDTIASLPPASRRLPPAEQKTLLRTAQQKLLEALDLYRANAKILPTNWHVVNTIGKSALITLWNNDMNQLVGCVKLFQAKSPSAIPFFWSNSDFARDTGYAIENAAQLKSDLNLKPSIVVGTGQPFTVDDLLEKISENITAHPELPEEVRSQVPALLNNVASGFAEPIPDAAKYVSSYEIDLGETAAPIALITGHFVSGAYKQIEDQLLKPIGSSWKKIKKCWFPMAGNEQLIDSYIRINDTTSLAVSSKDKSGGASASVTSLSAAIEKNPERYEDLLGQKKYKYLFNVLKLLKSKSAIDGPLELGVFFEIIDAADKKNILKYIDDPNTVKKDITKKLQKFLTDPIYKPNTHSPNYMIGFHLLTVVAHKVVAHLNENEKTVTAFFKEILSRADMIQVKTRMTKSGDGASYTDFNVIWPPIFDGQVKFNSQKNYGASAKPGGKITFKIG